MTNDADFVPFLVVLTTSEHECVFLSTGNSFVLPE